MAKTEKDIIVVIVSPEEKREENWIQPRANWWFIDCMGNTVYIKCTDKIASQEKIDSEYGVGKYKLQACKEKEAKGGLSCR